jgi:ABC-type sugar transport system substrate-binding protein
MKNIWIALVALVVFVVCPPAHAAASGAHKKPYNIALIIKATDSDFWQYVIIGGTNYGLDHPDQAKVSRYGPKSEADIDKQVAILEDVISRKPDAIVIASTSSDATVPALENAIDQGIVVVTIAQTRWLLRSRPREFRSRAQSALSAPWQASRCSETGTRDSGTA